MLDNCLFFKSLSKKIIYVIVYFLICVLITFFSIYWGLKLEAEQKIWGFQKNKIENAIVLIMGSKLNNNKMTDTLISRLDTFLSVSKEIPSGTLVIVSGGKGRDDSQQISESSLMKQYLVTHGIKKDFIVEETHASSTYENILYTQKYYHDKTLIVVSNDYHLARIGWILSKFGYKNYFFIEVPTDNVKNLILMTLRETLGIIAFKFGIY